MEFLSETMSCGGPVGMFQDPWWKSGPCEKIPSHDESDSLILADPQTYIYIYVHIQNTIRKVWIRLNIYVEETYARRLYHLVMCIYIFFIITKKYIISKYHYITVFHIYPHLTLVPVG